MMWPQEQLDALSPEAVTGVMENYTGPLHQPQTGAGRVGDALGQMIGDPSNLLIPPPARAGATAATKAAAPAAARVIEDALHEAAAPAIRAYHGSPHDFDRFSSSKIGTGEGNQAYGHGLYFAENEDVARRYRDRLSTPTGILVDSTGAEVAGLSDADKLTVGVAAEDPHIRGDIDKAIAYNEFWEKRWDGPQGQTMRDAALALRRWRDRGHTIRVDNPGKVYETRLNADPEHFLDWDTELRSQSPKVQEAMRRYWTDSRLPGDPMALKGHELHEEMTAANARYGSSPSVGAEMIAKDLRHAGIPGIRDYDAGSRDRSKGTRNYVVFDDSLIDVLKKYGLAGLIAGGASHFSRDDQDVK